MSCIFAFWILCCSLKILSSLRTVLLVRKAMSCNALYLCAFHLCYFGLLMLALFSYLCVNTHIFIIFKIITVFSWFYFLAIY